MAWHLSPKTGNRKLGADVASTTSGRDTCPPSCPLLGRACYAESGPLAWHWDKVSSGARGDTFGAFCDRLAKLPDGAKVRLGQAGDLPGTRGKLNGRKVFTLGAAVAHVRAWIYTHYRPTAANLVSLRALARTVAVNLSANSLTEADEYRATGLPVVVAVPSGHAERSKTPAGLRVLVCPEQTGRVANCSACMLCADTSPKRPVIAFRAHGRHAKLIS